MTPLSYHSSNSSLVALETMRLLVQKIKKFGSENMNLGSDSMNRNRFSAIT